MAKNSVVWKVGGEAGYGIMSSGMLFSKICKEHGLNIFSTTEYPSLIRGGHNTYIVRADEQKIFSHISDIDVLLCLDELTLDMHKDEVSKKGAIIYDEAIKNKKIRKDIVKIPLPLRQLAKKYGVHSKVMISTIGIGASAALLGLDIKIVKKLFKNQFKKKGKKVVESNMSALIQGYNLVKNKFKIQITKKPKKKSMFINGNTALAIGAIRAGCKIISAYPMTPATSIMQYMAKHQKSHNLIVHQSEDENAALNVALGASYTGVRAMTATSGGGFALMTETLSLAGSAEVPVVIVLSQRPGPATGLPTRTEQGDLLFATHAGHGEFQKLVITPGDQEECFYLTLEAFNWADKYQIPVIILLDKYLSVSPATIPLFKTDYKINRGALLTKVKTKLKPLEKFKRYKFTHSGISPRTIPGVANGIQLTLGDEHDEEGYIIEDAKTRILMADKRNRKMNGLKKELSNKCVSLYGNKSSKTAIVSWGSQKGIILEAMKSLKCKFAHIKITHPFPTKELTKKLGKFNKLILVEQNKTGQLGKLIKQNTNLKITKKILNYSGRPFNPQDIIKKVKK